MTEQQMTREESSCPEQLPLFDLDAAGIIAVPGTPAEPYADTEEHMADWFTAIHRRNEQQKGGRRSSEAAPLDLEAIRARERVTREMGLILPLEAVRAKYKLDDREVQILVEILYASVASSHRGSIEKKELVQKVAGNDPRLIIACQKYFQPEGRLIKNGLLVTERRFVQELSMREDIEECLLGIHRRPRAMRVTKSAIDPVTIYNRLCEWVVGQEEAKKRLAVAVAAHVRRGVGRRSPGKSNILLVGPTGSGKTHLCRTIAKILNVPLLITDATKYSETGYVGKDVGNMISDLVKIAKQDRKAAGRGIIFIDEIDKLAAMPCHGHRTNRDVGGESVQNELLAMLEGSTEIEGVDTGGILFIGGGAFTGIDAMREDCEAGGSGIGFLRRSSGGCPPDGTRVPRVNDFIQFGMIPELMGRFPAIIPLGMLSPAELETVLSDTRAPLINEYQDLFAPHGGIEITPAARACVAKLAHKKGLGARGLRAVLEEALTPLAFDRALKKNGQRVIITEEDILSRVRTHRQN